MAMDMKLEVIVLPVADVDRAKAFYTGLGWRLDADFAFDANARLVQVTPPGSQASVIFGNGATSAAPGSAQGLYLVVSDLEATRAELARRGVDVSRPFHRGAGGALEPGLDASRRSYNSLAMFRDPDGNQWLLQEITQRLPGRMDAQTAYGSRTDLASAMRRAEAAHGEHEKRIGQRDANWSDWYAEYMVDEQAGREPPP